MSKKPNPIAKLANGQPAYTRRPDLPAQNAERIARAREAQRAKEGRRA